MGELRWILLGLGVIVLAAIYAYSRYRMRRSADMPAADRVRVEPRLSSVGPDAEPIVPEDESAAPVAEPSPAASIPEKVVTIRLMSRDKLGFAGDKLILAMRGVGLRHGRFGIFHAHKSDSDDIVFSVANLVEPGTFDLASLVNTRLPGVSMFVVLPANGDSLEALDLMIDAARSLAASLDGELLDEQGSTFSVQRERYIRDEVQQFVRENLTLVSSSGGTR